MNDISTHTPDAPEPAAKSAETKPCHTLFVDDESDFEPMIPTRFYRRPDPPAICSHRRGGTAGPHA